MKLTKLILPVLILSLLLFSGCNRVESTATPLDIMAKIKIAIPEKEMIDGVSYIEAGTVYSNESSEKFGELPGEMMNEIYKSDFNTVESYSVWIAEENVVTEIGVFKLKDTADVEGFIDLLKVRIATLETAAAYIKMEEIKKADNAVISSDGKYVYYLITNINSILEEVILNEIAENQVTA